MSAFEDYVKTMMDHACACLCADIQDIPFSRLPLFKTLKYCFRVDKDFTYHHRDQDINNGYYTLVKDEIITLSEMDDMYFLPDKSNLTFVGRVWV